MSRRFKSPTMKFGVPLSVPGSRYVEHCYGMHGKGNGHTPPRDSTIELILVNDQRQLWRVDGYFPEPHKYVTDALGLGGNGWKILGWRMADGSMPLAITMPSIRSWRSSSICRYRMRRRHVGTVFRPMVAASIPSSSLGPAQERRPREFPNIRRVH